MHLNDAQTQGFLRGFGEELEKISTEMGWSSPISHFLQHPEAYLKQASLEHMSGMDPVAEMLGGQIGQGSAGAPAGVPVSVPPIAAVPGAAAAAPGFLQRNKLPLGIGAAGLTLAGLGTAYALHRKKQQEQAALAALAASPEMPALA